MLLRALILITYWLIICLSFLFTMLLLSSFPTSIVLNKFEELVTSIPFSPCRHSNQHKPVLDIHFMCRSLSVFTSTPKKRAGEPPRGRYVCIC